MRIVVVGLQVAYGLLATTSSVLGGLSVVAAAAWFSTALVLAVHLRKRQDEQPRDTIGLVTRFTAVSLAAAAITVVAGAAMVWSRVRGLSEVVGSAHGWVLSSQVAVVGLTVVVCLHARHLVPGIQRHESSAIGAHLRQAIWLQVGLLAVVLLLTGGLVAQRPPGASTAFDVVVPLTDDVDALVTVDPIGGDRATIHLYLLDPTGRPTRRAETVELAVRAGGSGDAMRVDPFPAGPGHWVANVAAVPEPGTWRLEVIAHLDDGGTARAHVSPDGG